MGGGRGREITVQLLSQTVDGRRRLQPGEGILGRTTSRDPGGFLGKGHQPLCDGDRLAKPTWSQTEAGECSPSWVGSAWMGMLCVGSSGLTKGLVSSSGSAKMPPDTWGIPPSPPTLSQQDEIALGAPTVSSRQKKRLSQQARALLGDGSWVCEGRGVSGLCDLEQVHDPCRRPVFSFIK